jgi:predicted dinucleotide-binding enzyme
MRYAVLGTGVVGQAIAARLVELGHEVRMGAREPDNEKAKAFADSAGELGSAGTFADAAAFGEAVVNATNGAASLEALAAAGTDALAGKVLIDVANVLDFSGGMPPAVGAALDDSLGERIQAAFPDAHVVKTLNTVNNAVMVRPAELLADDTGNVFLSGDDPHAKEQVAALLVSFGWPPDSIVDLGGIETARGPELYVAFWLRLWGTLGGVPFNVRVVSAGGRETP